MLNTKAADSLLTEIIRNEIRVSGPISFARFMQQALYHPQHGYYSSGRAAIGRGGDYFTNVSVGPLFGTLLAAQFIEIWDRLGKPGRGGDIDHFTIVEQGAHDGQFARDVLRAIRTRAPEMFEAVRYRIVEPFPIWQDRQRQTLASFGEKVKWAQELSAPQQPGPQLSPLPEGEADAKRRVGVNNLERFVGVHFSNELLDAMPVNLRGKLVGFDNDKFVFVENGRDESTLNQVQLDWIDNVAERLERGVVIAIDYGFSATDFHEVVQARTRHRNLDSPLEQIGESDISVHLNWTDIAKRAEINGLRVAGFTDQHHFFTGIISNWPNLVSGVATNLTALSRQVASEPGEEAKTKRALQTLLHPEMLGRAFQVLALAKSGTGFQPMKSAPGPNHRQDADATSLPLAGFRFAREPRTALELES